ncbi:YheC/YheD family protein [Longirhabdus pacifica]|uniref:YheC/YheD family protein n=1 Tax=Longirhabdus pacifica TaxID=2305227 RepID=UPI0013E8E387|nr:YheC/YheD family protein [Longirhabdus pacifica]
MKFFFKKDNDAHPTILGLFVNKKIIKDAMLGHINKHPNIAGPIQANKKVGVTLYLFSQHNVNFRRNTILGTVYDSTQKKWKKKRFVLPHVVYNFNTLTPRSTFIIKTMRKKGIRFITPPIRKYYKWHQHTMLSKNEEINKHLPDTRRVHLQRINVLRQTLRLMLNQYGSVYIKGNFANYGSQIFKVSTSPSPHHAFQYSFKRKHIIRGNVDNIDQIITVMKKYFKTNDLIIQQTIPLLHYKNQIVDFRAEAQRGKDGELNITGITTRIGVQNSPITNYGSMVDFDTFMMDYSDQISIHLDDLKNSVEEKLKQIYLAYEKEYGNIGEMGMDFALDTNFKFWHIECNRRSGKNAFLVAQKRQNIEKLYMNPLLYAKYLRSLIKIKKSNIASKRMKKNNRNKRIIMPRRSKMRIMYMLETDERIQPYLPETTMMSPYKLRRMLNKYKMVYIKPNDGGAGNRLMKLRKVVRNNRVRYQYDMNTPRRTISGSTPSFLALLKTIKRKKLNRPYVIQKGIHLLRYNNRITDLRVMVQKKRNTWKVTGIVVKIAVKNRVVTHSLYGSKLISLPSLLEHKKLSPGRKRTIQKQLVHLCIDIAKKIETQYPQYRDFGIDVGFDTAFKPWVLEVNYKKPSIKMFKNFDSTMYRRIKDNVSSKWLLGKSF